MKENKEYIKLINAATIEEFRKNLFEHFLYLADSRGFEPVLKAICNEAKSALVENGILQILFEDDMVLSGQAAADISEYKEWPESFQKCMAVHEFLSFPEDGWAIILGDCGGFDNEYLEEDLLKIIHASSFRANDGEYDLKDLSPLRALKKLTTVQIAHQTELSDLSPLNDLKKINYLDCRSTKVSFEQLLLFVTNHIDVLYFQTDCDIYHESFMNIGNLIESIEEKSFSIEKYGLGLCALVDWKLISIIMGGSDYLEAIELINVYMKYLHEKKNHRIEEKLFSDCIVILVKVNDVNLNKIVFENLYPLSIKESRTAFNLACFYAVNNNKEKVLEFVELSLDLGQANRDFITDSDFKNFQYDEDFIKLVKG